MVEVLSFFNLLVVPVIPVLFVILLLWAWDAGPGFAVRSDAVA